ncbi:MAG: LysR family transcriptional regulator, partial [Rhodocyclaceae bacterium]|nr:LysR family transcriptional regulator [Rhodocyclaceae bacterium]
MNQLEDMQIFVAAVEAASFTAAADKLGISKQLVSRRIMELEQRLDARLLNRSTRRLAVTELGRAYFERAVKIIEDVADAELAVSNQNTSPRGTLRVAAPMSFGTIHLSGVLSRFMLQCPSVSVELDLNDRLVDLISEGYDMAIRIGKLSDSSLVGRALAPISLATCCSPAYLSAHGAPARPEDLRSHDCLLYGHGKGVEWAFEEAGKPLAVVPAGRLRANNGEVARDAAIAGLGIARLPTFIVAPALRDGRLVRVLGAFEPPPSAVYAVYPRHRQSFQAIRAFVDFLVVALQG